MADNEEELVDYDEEEVRSNNHNPSSLQLSSMDPLAAQIANYGTAGSKRSLSSSV
jgi:hypothetical protein